MLKLENVILGYKKRILVNDINISFEAGNLYILTGENGTGKTSLLKLMAGCISCLGGEIIVDNVSVGYLPFKTYFPSFMNSYSYLNMFSQIYKNDYLYYTKRYNLDDTTICKLSKGNMIKLGIIQTLICDFDMYLFDEANDGLDIDSKKVLKEDIKDLLSKNKCVVVSTHTPTLFKDLNPIKLSIKGNKLYEKKKK